MIDALIGIGLMAVLFVVSGIFRHRGCTGHCAGCTGECGRHQEEEGQ